MSLSSVASEKIRFIRVTFRAVALGEGGSAVYRTVNPNDLTWRSHSRAFSLFGIWVVA